MLRGHAILILFFLGCICIPAGSQAQNLPVSQITSKRTLSVEDGLASREVFCAIQDDQGFMWFGTRNGLNRYDGKKTKLFTKERNGLAENKIIQLAKDNNNQLLIVYGSAGFERSVTRIEVMNLATYEIRSLEEAFPGLPFKGKNVYWVANGGGELCFLIDKPFQYWRLTSKGFELKCEMKAWDRLQAADKKWLTAKDNYHKESGPLCQFFKDCALLRVGNDLPGYFCTPQKVEMHTASDGMLIDSNRQLIFSWPQVYRKLNPQTSINALPSIASTYLQGAIYFLSGDYSQSLVYKARDGLYLYDGNTLKRLMLPEELKIASGYGLYSYFIDRQKNIWICTAAGLLKIKQENNRFTHYFTKSQLKDSSDNQVRGIFADEKGQVYAASWNRLWYSFQGKNISASIGLNDIIYGIHRNGDKMYVGELNIFLFDPQDKKVLKKLTDSVLTEIWSLDSLSSEKLLVGTTNAILTYSISRNEISPVTYPNDSIPKAKFVYRFIRRKDNKFWVIAQNGLYLLNEGADQVIDYFGGSSLTPAHRLPFDILLDAYEDEKGFMWFATNGSGLFRWDRTRNTFKHFNSTDGLPSDILYRIESDDNSNLWISTDNGLMRINTKDFTSSSYSTSSGISHNEFNRASSFKATDGRLFFGGLDGVNAFYPNDFNNDKRVSDLPVRIISYSKFSAE
ncbi:MAG: two-component regulator propeller domain-containing protein, partial [Chitinophagaceae bacterium]